MNLLNLCLAICVLSLVVILGCVPSASDAEVEAACQQLETLQGGQPADEASARLEKCKQDLERENVSKESAQCRAKAKSLDQFWNICR